MNALFIPKENRSEEQRAIFLIGNTLIKKLETVGAIASSAPMYNFSIPSTLTPYFDYIARAGRPFKYTETESVQLYR